jgi:ADP-ribose pyrophosphatase YjhB (NUDIX family)
MPNMVATHVLSYTDGMTGYVKGDTPDGEIEHMHEAWYRATAAIQASPNPGEALKAAKALAELVEKLRGETADFRDWLAAYLADAHGFTHDELAASMGVSRAAVSQRIKRAREKGNPVTEPATLPEQPHVGLAIITSDRGVLIAKRRDGIPPWTFLGGDIRQGESARDALRRRVQAEGGLAVENVNFIGRRIHPKTSRVMVYCHVAVAAGDPQLGDPEDLEEVRWVSIDETRDLMPDMYGPVRQYLDEMQRQPPAD